MEKNLTEMLNYKLLAKNLNHGIIITNEKGKIIFFNNYLKQIYPKLLPEQDVFHLITEKYKNTFKKHFHNEKATAEDFEIPMYANKGKQYWMLVNISTTKSDDEIKKICSFVDISKKKNIEEAHLKLLKFDQLVTSLSSNFINLPLEGIDKGINQALKKIGQFSNVDRSYVFLINHNKKVMNNTHEWCAKGIHPQKDSLQDLPLDIFPWWMEYMNKFEHLYIPSVVGLPKEAVVEKKILQEQDILSLVVVPMISRGKLYGFMGFDSVHEHTKWSDDSIALLRMVGEIFVNALERKKTEIALNKKTNDHRASEERLKAIMNSIPDFIFYKNKNGYYEGCNKAFENFVGMKQNEIIGKKDAELFDKKFANDQKEKDVEMYEKAKETRHQAHIEYPGGKKIWVDTVRTPCKNEKGESLGMVGVSRDISIMKQTQERLKRAKQAEQDANKAKSQFLANMSHEIRTPLNGIIGMAHLLENSQITGKQQQYLDAILVSSKNLMVIIDDILDFSKIESGQLHLEKVGFNLLDQIKSVHDSVSYKIKNKGLDFFYNIDSKIHNILMGDPVRINQILLNLLSNAIKFTNNGSITINAKLIESSNNKQTVEIKVADTGIGISKENLNSIFESFKQEDGSTTKKYGGTGLGLAISKQLVKLMKGNIKAESIKDLGTVFTFTIPFEKGTDKDLVSSSLLNKKSENKNNNLNRLAILLVEDHEVNQFLISSILKEWNTDVDIAQNGQEAIEKAVKKEYALILMDIQMPVKNGYDAAWEIRHKLQLKVPIIALTANALRNTNEKCINAGMNDYISKPFEPEELFNKIIKNTDISRKPVATQTKSTKKQPVNKPSEKMYNLKKLSHMLNGNIQEQKRMIGMFLKITPNLLKELNENYEQENLEKVKTLAHKMKPSIDILGISSLTNEIRLIEKLAEEQKQSHELSSLISLLNKNMAKTIEQMQVEIN